MAVALLSTTLSSSLASRSAMMVITLPIPPLPIPMTTLTLIPPLPIPFLTAPSTSGGTLVKSPFAVSKMPMATATTGRSRTLGAPGGVMVDLSASLSLTVPACAVSTRLLSTLTGNQACTDMLECSLATI